MTAALSMSELTTVASICPACGHPRLLAGDAPMVRCSSCGQEHPVEPDLARAAEAYRRAQANLPLQLAQTADIDAISGASNLVAHRYRVAAGVLAGPLTVLALAGLVLRASPHDDTHRNRFFFTATYEAPLLVLVATGLGALLLLRRRRAAIERLLWARALADVRGALVCRMCGGPLESHPGSSAVVACRFCHADNMVGAEVSAEAARLALADYVGHASSVIDGTTRRAGDFLAQAAIALPLLALVVIFSAQWRDWKHALAQRRPPDATLYEQVHCGQQRMACLHHAGEDLHDACDQGPMQVSATSAGQLAGRAIEPSDLAWDDGIELIGDVTDLRVTQIYRDGLGRNHVRAAAAFGVKGDALVEGLCVTTRDDGGAP